MKINFKVFLKGAVIMILTAPFLFGGTLFSQEISLKLFDDHVYHNEIASLTSYARNSEDSLKNDSTFKTAAKTKKFRMKKSPTVALLLSAVLPGAGQFYNQSYWKVPIIDGFIIYFGYEYFRNNNLYKDYGDLYASSQTPEDPNGDLNYKTLREFYRGQRNDFVWYFLIVYTINLIDAYVDAHLFDFDVSEEKLTPYGDSGKVYRLKINLKL